MFIDKFFLKKIVEDGRKAVKKNPYIKISLFVYIVLLGLLIFSGFFKKDERVIRIVFEKNYYPFSAIDKDGNGVGFNIDIADAICEVMKLKCEKHFESWDNLIPLLLEKKYDVVFSSMSIAKSHKELVVFTNKYYVTTNHFVGLKEKNFNITEDIKNNKLVLSGLRIGVQKGSVLDDYISENYGKVALIKRYDDQEKVKANLVQGNIDLIFADTLAMEYGFLNMQANARFGLIGSSFSNKKIFGSGIGIAVRKEEKSLLKIFNKGIHIIRENDFYSNIQTKYFNYDIYEQ